MNVCRRKQMLIKWQGLQSTTWSPQTGQGVFGGSTHQPWLQGDAEFSLMDRNKKLLFNYLLNFLMLMMEHIIDKVEIL